jgi:hypothetical protein
MGKTTSKFKFGKDLHVFSTCERRSDADTGGKCELCTAVACERRQAASADDCHGSAQEQSKPESGHRP